jgi:hypothetical protein
MRVAICYSGHVDRLVKDSQPFITQLKSYNNCDNIDFFFSLWRNNDAGTSEKYIKDLISTYISTSHNIFIEWQNSITSCPLKHTVCDHDLCSHYQPISWYSQYTGIKLADQFRQKHSNDYDFVIRSRLDIGLSGNVDFNLWDGLLNSYDVLLPGSWNWFMYWSENCKMLNDQFFVARPITMSNLVRLADRMDEYIDNGCRFHGESLMWWNIHHGCNATYHLADFDTVLRGVIETR